MTVSYASEVTTNRGFGNFIKLLIRWKGSIYKLIWGDLILFLGIYYALNLGYYYAMDWNCKSYFVKIVTYCAKNTNLIPLSFVLGFFVNAVYTRWWNQFTAIPFPDNLAIMVGAHIKGQDERARIVRRTIVRYVCVTFTLTLSMISPKVKKRFPTLNHFVDARLLTKEEKTIIEDLDNGYQTCSKNWVPLAWAANITTMARHEGIIGSDSSVKSILDQINIFRSKCGELLAYDWISIPLVYTQVVTIAVYSYFLIRVIGNQMIELGDSVDRIIFSFPFMPVLEFFFYMGWLKVAETLINPFGEDDDDFEVVWMIDRHIQVCYLLVDKIHQDHPTLTKDYYWFQSVPDTLPFTVASQKYMMETPVHSAENLEVKKTDQDLIIPEESQHIVRHKRNERKGSIWSSIRGAFTKNKQVQYPLEDIAIDGTENSKEVNGFEEGPSNATHTTTMCNDTAEEFENLKKERQEKRKGTLLKYIELLKNNKVNKEPNKKVIDYVK